MQSKDEYKILQRVQALIESDYVDGKPRHHLPSARSVELLPGASSFFIIDHQDFQKLSPHTIQAIHRHRHILIENVPQRDFTWSLETLREVGSIEQPRDIQGMLFCLCYLALPHKLSVGEFRGQKSVPGMLKVGTLHELFGHASRRVMNCLSITTSSHDIVTTPGLRYGISFLVNFPC
jgi:hypothetical protein